MSNNITNLRSLERSYLSNDGKLDKTEAAALAAIAKKSGSAEDLAALKEMFSRDAFDDKADPNKVLSAAGLKATVVDGGIAGRKVGEATVNGKTMDVTVARTLGAPEGYRNKFQALAAARMSGEPNAVVVRGQDDRWHAAQTTVKADKLTTEGFPLAPLDRKAYETLRDNVRAAVDQRKQTDPHATPTDDELKQLASLALGIPASEIATVHMQTTKQNPEYALSSNDNQRRFLDPNKITINTAASAYGETFHMHGPNCGCGDPAAAQLDQGSRLTLSAGRLMAGPEAVAATLFHEGTHYSNNQLGRQALSEWTKATGGKLDSEKSRQKFIAWVDKQPDAHFSKADKAMINNVSLATHPSGETEGTAYVRAFLATIEADPTQAAAQLQGFGEYEDALRQPLRDKNKQTIPDPDHKGRVLMDPKGTINPAVRNALIAEMKAKFATLPEASQAEFRKAVAALDAQYPATHMSEAMGFRRTLKEVETRRPVR